MWPFDPPQDGEGWAVAFGTAVVLILIGILAVLFWVRELTHAIRNPDLSDAAKIAWVLAILVLPVAGAILYALFRPGSAVTGPRT